MAADLAIKEPCRAATTGNITLSGLQTIDGVTLATGNRVLVKAQSNAINNGIYVAASGGWSRATDFDGAGEATGGTEVFVAEGSANADTSWRVGGYLPIAIGTDSINFEPDFVQSGTGSVRRTLQDKSRDIMSLKDKGSQSDMASALANAAADLAAGGGEVLVTRGNWTLPSTVTFAGHRLHIRGEGEQVSIVDYAPGSAGDAFVFDAGGAVIGGITQTSVKGLAFNGGSSTSAKTAIRLVNAANSNVEHIATTQASWLGDSIGIKTEGRQFVRIRDCTLACARPIVFGANPVFETISTDHFVVDSCELIGTFVNRPVIEFESGTSFSNTTISGTAIAGGAEGIKWNDHDSTAVGYHLRIRDSRFEQGLDPIAFNILLASSARIVQEVLIENVRLDAARQGIFLRYCQSVTLKNVNFAMGNTPIMLVRALQTGSGGNSIATSETLGSGSFSGSALIGGQTGVAATGRLWMLAKPAAGETVTIGNRTYTFRTAVSAANDVKIGDIGAVVHDSMNNLRDAINGAAGDGATTGPGFTYGTGTTAHADVSARGGAILPLRAIAPGTGGNSLATTETLANGSFGGSTMSGGAGDEHATGLLSLSAQPADNETVTIGAKTYTFKTTLTETANDVLIGANAIDSVYNLRDAVNAGAGNAVTTGPGLTYSADTTVNGDVNASGDVALDMKFEAGSRLTMINCLKQTGSIVNLTNAICVRREYVSSVGLVEEWVYRASAASGIQVSDAYWGGVPFRLAHNKDKTIADSSFTGFLFVSASDDVNAIYAVRGAAAAVAEVSDANSAFSPTKGSGGLYNIYPESGAYKIENQRGAPSYISVFRLGTNV